MSSVSCPAQALFVRLRWDSLLEALLDTKVSSELCMCGLCMSWPFSGSTQAHEETGHSQSVSDLVTPGSRSSITSQPLFRSWVWVWVAVKALVHEDSSASASAESRIQASPEWTSGSREGSPITEARDTTIAGNNNNRTRALLFVV